MARNHCAGSIVLGLAMLSPCVSAAGEMFTGFQIDNHSQYYAYTGVRLPIGSGEGNLQPFAQFMGAGLGYSFRDNGVKRDANVQFATPALGLKYLQGPWTFLGFVGPQIRWKQQDLPGSRRSHEHDVGVQVQGEAFHWQEQGTVHAIISYTNLDGLVWSRLRVTRLALKNEGGCCSLYLGGEIAGMGNKDFYAVQTGPVLQVPIGVFYLTVKGGYQYSQTFHHGGYGGLELYVPF